MNIIFSWNNIFNDFLAAASHPINFIRIGNFFFFIFFQFDTSQRDISINDFPSLSSYQIQLHHISSFFRIKLKKRTITRASIQSYKIYNNLDIACSTRTLVVDRFDIVSSDSRMSYSAIFYTSYVRRRTAQVNSNRRLYNFHLFFCDFFFVGILLCCLSFNCTMQYICLEFTMLNVCVCVSVCILYNLYNTNRE